METNRYFQGKGDIFALHLLPLFTPNNYIFLFRKYKYYFLMKTGKYLTHFLYQEISSKI
jgi:hypothetical protein